MRAGSRLVPIILYLSKIASHVSLSYVPTVQYCFVGRFRSLQCVYLQVLLGVVRYFYCNDYSHYLFYFICSSRALFPPVLLSGIVNCFCICIWDQLLVVLVIEVPARELEVPSDGVRGPAGAVVVTTTSGNLVGAEAPVAPIADTVDEVYRRDTEPGLFTSASV